MSCPVGGPADTSPFSVWNTCPADTGYCPADHGSCPARDHADSGSCPTGGNADTGSCPLRGPAVCCSKCSRSQYSCSGDPADSGGIPSRPTPPSCTSSGAVPSPHSCPASGVSQPRPSPLLCLCLAPGLSAQTRPPDPLHPPFWKCLTLFWTSGIRPLRGGFCQDLSVMSRC